MNEEDLFAAAKLDIFGREPKLPATRIARKMALCYLEPIMRLAEAVQIGTRMPDHMLALHLRNAFDFSRDPSMNLFPQETKEALDEYARNFQTRYEPLLKELELRAA